MNRNLIMAAISCFLAALAHIGCIFFGADWYRFFGAGEEMAQMAEQGLWYPTVVTLTISLALTTWGIFALSGAGVIRKLPFTQYVLVIIASVFIVRAVAFVALMPRFPENSLVFWLVSSSICLVIGLLFAIGVGQQWRTLNN
ncbi:hypothetical protein BIY21_04425 [Vibrio ponticus]|uniref:Uncharacterized protein n=1 Tax=Vibrio ponticus TaxID=265668 RepID=A0ABX3F5Y3_9VIBR|nr:hypothetical protein [Vibrio ponticus]OLQ85489.1 hypothetical protein BIY21_04425 [Vibrio ponticus]